MAALNLGFVRVGEGASVPANTQPVQTSNSTLDFSDWFDGWGMKDTVPNYEAGKTIPTQANARRVPGANGAVGQFLEDYGMLLAIGAGLLVVVVVLKRR
jgi:hypothetical protein